MNNFGLYLTPAEAFLRQIKTGLPRDEISLAEYERRSRNESLCAVCHFEKVWKLVDTGLCFSCTTGESDASNDCELI